MEYKGIDISRHNLINDFSLTAKKIDFAIMRAGGNFNGYYKDSKFERNYNLCKQYNIPCGAYYDAGKVFYEASTGVAYAKHFCDLLSGHVFEYPVYLDIEVTPRKYKKQITEACIAFCEYMESKKYFVGIYGSDISTFHDMIYLDQVEQFSLWVARYGNKPKYVKKYGIWQYTSKGRIEGITGNVDLDVSYVDFTKIMKGVHLNGY